MPHAAPHTTSPVLARFDAGWLYVLAGLALIASTVLISADAGLENVQWQLRRGAALEAHRLARLDRYEAYLAALEREDERLILALAAEQLHELPAGRVALARAPTHKTVFASLEPPPLELPQREVNKSLLARMAIADGVRPWLLAAGGICLFIGLLPPARAPRRATDGDSKTPPPTPEISILGASQRSAISAYSPALCRVIGDVHELRRTPQEPHQAKETHRLSCPDEDALGTQGDQSPAAHRANA